MSPASLMLALRLGVLAAGSAGPAPPAPGFPQWRGAFRDGSIALARPSWPEALQSAWSAKTGIGHASPVVSDGRVFVFSREGENETVRAIDLSTGEEIWRDAYLAPYKLNPAAVGHGKGPRATPVVSGNRVFTLGIEGTASALDARSGRLLWRRSFEETSMERSPAYGVASSPIILGRHLLVAVGDRDQGALVALDPGSGRERWRFAAEGPGYASPIVAQIAEEKHIVMLTRTRLVGLSINRGVLLWSVPFSTDYDQNAVTPLVRDGVVFYSGLAKGVMAIRPVSRGTRYDVERVWTNPEVSMHLSSPVLSGGRLIGFSHRRKGQFFALDVRTGKTLWLSEGRQGENAALLAGDGFWMALTDEGRLIVGDAAADAFRPVRTYTVAESATWASPAIGGGGILVKDVDTLTLWRFEGARTAGEEPGSRRSTDEEREPR